jgi:hypothetical protein
MLLLLVGTSVQNGGGILPVLVGEVLSLLLVVGLWAIWHMQPQTGRLGLAGLWCLGVAAGIAFLVRLIVLTQVADPGEVLPFVSALFGLVGSLLVGWATVRARVFLPAFGWLLMLSGVLNFVGGLISGGPGATVVGILATLAQAGALGGYGWTMLRSAGIARPASVPQR